MKKLWQVTYEKNGVEHSIQAEALNKIEAQSLARQHERGAWIEFVKVEEVK